MGALEMHPNRHGVGPSAMHTRTGETTTHDPLGIPGAIAHTLARQ